MHNSFLGKAQTPLNIIRSKSTKPQDTIINKHSLPVKKSNENSKFINKVQANKSKMIVNNLEHVKIPNLKPQNVGKSLTLQLEQDLSKD